MLLKRKTENDDRRGAEDENHRIEARELARDQMGVNYLPTYGDK